MSEFEAHRPRSLGAVLSHPEMTKQPDSHYFKKKPDTLLPYIGRPRLPAQADARRLDAPWAKNVRQIGKAAALDGPQRIKLRAERDWRRVAKRGIVCECAANEHWAPCRAAKRQGPTFIGQMLRL